MPYNGSLKTIFTTARLRVFLICLHTVLATGIALSLLLAVILYGIWKDLPDISDPEALLAAQSVVITDREGSELYRFFQEQDRSSLTADALPQPVTNAIIAIEDKRFWTRRFCIDIQALGRAVLANMGKYKSQGASTITQQLVRTALLTREKTFVRKAKEIMLACQLEQTHSKEEILSLYLNWISFGHGIGGVQQAAKRFFGVDAHNLTLEQSAVLASLPQRPSYFSPYGSHRQSALTQGALETIWSGAVLSVSEIRDDDIVIGLLPIVVSLGENTVRISGRSSVVLKAMLDQEMITREEWQWAEEQLDQLSVLPRRDFIAAPHFTIGIRDAVQDLMRRDPRLTDTDGLHIHTTLDTRLQALTEDTVMNHQQELLERFHANNIAIVIVNKHTGEVQAYVGNTDYFADDIQGQIDMARRQRQTGSAFKPFIYAMLFEQGYTPESIIRDSPLDPQIYRAHKSGYYGRMSMRNALGRSRNIPAVRAFYMAGGEPLVLDFAESVGIESPKERWQREREEDPRFKYAWTLALGAGESSLLEMVEGYSVLANGGMHQSLIGIEAVTNQQGEILFAPVQTRQRVLTRQSAQYIEDILSDAEAREPDWRYQMDLSHGRKAALKTGTGNICRARGANDMCTDIVPNNTWALGWRGDFVIGVWVGNADHSPMAKETTSLESAAMVWRSLVEGGLERGLIQ